MAERLDDCSDAVFDFLLAGDVHLDADRVGAFCLELFRGRVRAVEIEIGDRDRGAIVRVDLRDALADAAGGAGHERDFAVESHARPP